MNGFNRRLLTTKKRQVRRVSPIQQPTRFVHRTMMSSGVPSTNV